MPKVGGEVDALCTKCELVLAHTVIAMVGPTPVKVECNTCRRVHRFRGPATPRARAAAHRPRSARAPRASRSIVSFDELLATRSIEAAVQYSPRQQFKLDDVVDHPLFGRGFVSAVRDAAKIEVTFRTDVKVLVHGRT